MQLQDPCDYNMMGGHWSLSILLWLFYFDRYLLDSVSSNFRFLHAVLWSLSTGCGEFQFPFSSCCTVIALHWMRWVPISVFFMLYCDRSLLDSMSINVFQVKPQQLYIAPVGLMFVVLYATGSTWSLQQLQIKHARFRGAQWRTHRYINNHMEQLSPKCPVE